MTGPSEPRLVLHSTGGKDFTVLSHIATDADTMLEVVNGVTASDPASDPWIDCEDGRMARWRFVEGMTEVK